MFRDISIVEQTANCLVNEKQIYSRRDIKNGSPSVSLILIF